MCLLTVLIQVSIAQQHLCLSIYFCLVSNKYYFNIRILIVAVVDVGGGGEGGQVGPCLEALVSFRTRFKHVGLYFRPMYLSKEVDLH